MDSLLKRAIEDIVQDDLIQERKATQEQIKRFFKNKRLRQRIVAGFDDMIASENTPVLRCMEEAETD